MNTRCALRKISLCYGIPTSTSTTPVTSRLIFSTTTRNIADTSAGAASCLYVNEVGRRSHFGVSFFIFSVVVSL